MSKFELISPWGLESNSTFVEGETLEEACKGLQGHYAKEDGSGGTTPVNFQNVTPQEIEIIPYMQSENVWLVSGRFTSTDLVTYPQCCRCGPGKCTGHEVGSVLVFQELAIEVK